jgi:phospholipid/cholesterol/gamma-HCH transport system substrate-binding protein
MGQRAPTLGQIAVAVAFAFSCFGLLLFLWATFGGPVPLKPEGYRIKVPFSEASQLAVESDVRINNVSVGKVKKIDLADSGPNRDLAVATLEIDTPYAPIPEDTRAMLRQKTLLGETYVELTQGDDNGPKLPEGGSLPRAQVQPSVQLDEIFRTFDARTRAAFQTWMQQLAIASAGRGADLSAAIANLEPFAQDANRVLRVLDSQQGAVSQLVRNTGEVFGALSERQGQLQGLIRNAGTVFATTARRNRDLEAAFRALPTFLDESSLTLNRLETFSKNANPLITQLHPSAKLLSADLKQVAKVAPDFHGFFTGFRKVELRSNAALSAVRSLLGNDLPPVLTAIQPFLSQLTPIVTGALRYDREITGFLGNATGATQATASLAESNSQPVHYLRTSGLLSPEAFAWFTPLTSAHRLTTNRANPYTEPGGALKVSSGLESFPVDACPGPQRIIAVLDPNSPNLPAFNVRTGGVVADAQDLFDRIKKYGFASAASFPLGNLSSAQTDAPPCINQGPQPTIGTPPAPDPFDDYLHVYPTP